MQIISSSRVSIITPCYNAEAFIRETHASVLDQALDDWEWLLADDCSTDGTYKIIAAFEKDPRIRVFRTPRNMGAGYARNLCIQNATGRFLAFLDADDLWKPEKLLRQKNFMLEKNAAISHVSYTFITENREERNTIHVTPLLDLDLYMRRTEIPGSTAMIDRTLFPRVRFPVTRSREDTLFWVSTFRKGNRSYGLDEPLVFYRSSRTQVTSVGNIPRMVWHTFLIFMRTGRYIGHGKALFYFLCHFINACKKRL